MDRRQIKDSIAEKSAHVYAERMQAVIQNGIRENPVNLLKLCNRLLPMESGPEPRVFRRRS